MYLLTKTWYNPITILYFFYHPYKWWFQVVEPKYDDQGGFKRGFVLIQFFKWIIWVQSKLSPFFQVWVFSPFLAQDVCKPQTFDFCRGLNGLKLKMVYLWGEFEVQLVKIEAVHFFGINSTLIESKYNLEKGCLMPKWKWNKTKRCLLFRYIHR